MLLCVLYAFNGQFCICTCCIAVHAITVYAEASTVDVHALLQQTVVFARYLTNIVFDNNIRPIAYC